MSANPLEKYAPPQDKVQDSFAATELAYNILESLRLYSDNSDCRLFSAMLAGEARSFIWADQTSVIEKLRVSMIILFVSCLCVV